MPDQADHLRELVRQTVANHPPLGPGVPLIVLSGGRTGEGVTTLAIRLARELASLGKRAVLVDAHLGQPDVASQLNMEFDDSLADVLDGSRSVVEVLRPLGEAISVLPARDATATNPDLGRVAFTRLLSELRGLHAHADVIVVDAGREMSPWVQHWWRAAQQVLLVTSPDPSSIKAGYTIVKLAPWGDADGKVRVVVNRSFDERMTTDIAERFVSTCRKFLGLRVDAAPPVAIAVDNSSAFEQSVRLVAAELLSNCLVVRRRLSRRTCQPRMPASLLATTENFSDSANNAQSVPHK